MFERASDHFLPVVVEMDASHRALFSGLFAATFLFELLLVVLSYPVSRGEAR